MGVFYMVKKSQQGLIKKRSGKQGNWNTQWELWEKRSEGELREKRPKESWQTLRESAGHKFKLSHSESVVGD